MWFDIVHFESLAHFDGVKNHFCFIKLNFTLPRLITID